VSRALHAPAHEQQRCGVACSMFSLPALPQQLDVGGVVLAVAVEGGDQWRTGMTHPGGDGRALAAIGHMLQHTQIKVVVRPDGQVEAAGKATTQHDQPLLVALTRAFYWQQLLDDGVVSSGSEIAQREGLHHSTVNELLRLALRGSRPSSEPSWRASSPAA